MDSNELIKIILDRTQLLTDRQTECRQRSPAAAAIIEELLRDIQKLQTELFDSEEI